MGFLERLFGSEPEARPPQQQPIPRSDDERAIERYRYLLRTAPPETVERVHAEAFARLTPEQRRQVLIDVSAALPQDERPRGDDASSIARAATRAEYTNPGFMERTLGRGGPATGFGAVVGGSLLGTVAGYVVGSALMSAFLAPMVASEGGPADESGAADADASGADSVSDGGDAGWGGDDFGGGMDFGGFDGF